MALEHDPNLWSTAIPAAITAISTWYLNRKQKQTAEKTNTKTEGLVSTHADEVGKRLSNLEERMKKVEDSINKTRDTQIILAQKYVDTVSMFSTELKAAKEAFKRINFPSVSTVPLRAPSDPNPDQNGGVPMKSPAPDLGGKIVVVDEPPQPHGKVIRKP